MKTVVFFVLGVFSWSLGVVDALLPLGGARSCCFLDVREGGDKDGGQVDYLPDVVDQRDRCGLDKFLVVGEGGKLTRLAVPCGLAGVVFQDP